MSVCVVKGVILWRVVCEKIKIQGAVGLTASGGLVEFSSAQNV